MFEKYENIIAKFYFYDKDNDGVKQFEARCR